MLYKNNNFSYRNFLFCFISVITAILLMFRLFFIFIIYIILRTVAGSESATGLALFSLLTIFEIRVNFYVTQSLFENKQKNNFLCC